MVRNVGFLALGLIVLLSGCSTTGGTANQTSLYWVLPPVGSRIELNQTLSVDGGSRMMIQYGAPRNRRNVTQVDPYCYFNLWRTPEDITKPASISADTFVVTRVYRQRVYSALDPLRYAHQGEYFGPETLVAQMFSNGASNVYMSTFMDLVSSDQPQVKTLVCTRWDIPMEQNFVSIDEMQAALGDVARIVLPDGFLPGN